MIGHRPRSGLGLLFLAGALSLSATGASRAGEWPSLQAEVESCRALLAEPLPDTTAEPPADLPFEPSVGSPGESTGPSAAHESPSGDTEACAIQQIALSIDYFCPTETQALMEHPLSSLLTRERGDLQLQDLEGFHNLVQGYAHGSPVTAVGVDSLDGILADFEKPAQETISFGQRVWQWLKGLWGDRETPDFEWLENFSLSEAVVKAIMYGSLGLIVLLALVIVGMEIRAANISLRRSATARWQDAGPGQQAALTLDMVRDAPLREQPGLLLLLLLQRLTDSGQLQVAASSTHREITLAAKALDDSADLVRLSAAAERAAYGGWEPLEDDVTGLRTVFDKAMNAVARRESSRKGEGDDE